MKKVTQEELDKIIEQHEECLNNDSGNELAILCFMDLTGLDLSRRNLSRITFRFCNFNSVDFHCSNLSEATIIGCRLIHSNMSDVDMSGSYLFDCVITDCNLSGSNLFNFDTACCHFKNINFTNTNLTDVDMAKTTITDSIGLRSAKEILDELFKKTDEGYIVYKVFGMYYEIPDYWNIEEDSIIEEKVDMNRMETCSYGINVAIKPWIEKCINKGQQIWKCLLSFDDLDKVCVPYGTDGKIRCGRLKLLEIVG